MRELVRTQSFKQEPFSSPDENDRKPVQISKLEGVQTLFKEKAHDTDIKCEIPVEDCKPVLKDLVAVVPNTPLEGWALPEVSCSLVLNISAYRTFSQGFSIFSPLSLIQVFTSSLMSHFV